MSDVGVKMQVHVRVRPRRPGDSDRAVSYVKGQYPHYEFDAVFDEQSSQREVFHAAVQPLVDAMEQGMDSAVLVYGAPGAGKTHTLVGPKGTTTGSPTEGLVQQAVAAAFRMIGRLPHENLALKASYTALTAGSDGGFLFDLLTPGAPPVSIKDSRAQQAMDAATLFALDGPADISEVLRVGQVAQTLAAEATRPAGGYRLDEGVHLALTLHLERRSAGSKVSVARVAFVDLAGPESREEGAARNTPAAARAKATAFQALSAVLKSVHEASSKAARGPGAPSKRPEFSHIPWRDSPLTVWLKDALFSAAHVAVLACIHATSEHANDTIATLSWASRLRPASNGKGVMVTPTWGNAAASTRQLRTLEDWGYTPSKAIPAAQRASYDSHTALALPASSSPTRPGLELSTSPGALARSLAMADLADSGSPGATMGGGALARAAELDMEKVSELLEIIRQSGLPAPRVLRGQAVLQRLAETVGELRRSLAIAKGESRSLRKQLQEVVLRLDESREKTGDAHFMVEALRNEQDRLMRDHNAALDGAMAELEMLRQHLRTAEKEKAALMESLQADRRAKEAAERKEQEARRKATVAESQVSELSRERDHWKGQSEELRDQVARASAEVSNLRAKGAETQRALEAEVEASQRQSRQLDEAHASLRQARSQAEKVPTLEAQLHEAQSELRGVKDALAGVTAERRRLEAASREAEDRLGAVTEAYERALAEGREEESRMQGQVLGLGEQLRAEGERAAALVEALARARQAAEDEITSLRSALDSSRSDCAAREADVSRLRAACDTLEARLSEQQRRGDDLDAEVDRLEARARQQARTIEQSEAQRAKVESDLDACRQQASQLGQERADLMVRVGQLERDLSKERGDARDARAEARHEAEMRAAAEARAEDLSAELREAGARGDALETQLGEAEAQCLDMQRRLQDRSEECADLHERLAAAHQESRALAARLDEALAEGEALRQELAALSGRHEAKVSECEAVRDAKAQLERESADAIAALDNERRALEDRARAHRRLLAELSLLLSVEGVGVQSDFASPVVSEMVVRQCRDVTARARAAGRQAGEAGQQATRELEARLEAAISQQTRAAREAEQRIDEWRRKCEGLQRRVSQLEADVAAASAGATAEEAAELRRRLAEEERRARQVEARLRDAEARALRGSPGARAAEAEARASARQARALEETTEAARRERQRAQEQADRAQREAASLRVELEQARLSLASQSAQLRALEQDLERAMQDKAEANRLRIEVEGQLHRGRLDHIVEASRMRALSRHSPSPPRGVNASTLGMTHGATPGPLARFLEGPFGSAATPGAGQSRVTYPTSPSLF